MIFDTKLEEIVCEDCYNAIDQYVDMMRAGHDAGEILPQVKAHLGICPACDEEFKALIAILEAEVDQSDTKSG
jgi:hypothetical protein